MHQRIVNPTIANFFVILLQYNSKVRIVELYCSNILKNIIIFYLLFPPKISLSSISLFKFSSLSSFSVSPSALSFLQTQTLFSSQHQHHTSQWLIFSDGLWSGGFCGWVFLLLFFIYIFFLAWVVVWVTMVVVVFGVIVGFFFFFCCD